MKKPFRRSRQSALHCSALQSSFASVFSAAAIGLALLPTAANAAPLAGWQVNPATGQVTFIVPDGVEPRYFLMAQPARIVIDIPDAQIGDLPLDQTYSDGPVRRVTLEQNQPKLLRATLEMSPKAKFSRGQVRLENNGDGTDGTNTRWSVTPLVVGATSSTALPPTKPIVSTPTPQPSPAPKLESAQPPASTAKPTPPTPKPAEFPPGMQPIDRPLTPPSLTPIAPAKPPNLGVKSPLPVASLPPARTIDPNPSPAVAPPALPGVVSQPLATTSPADVPLMSLPQSLPAAMAPARAPQASIVVPPLASIPKLEVPSTRLPSTSQSAPVPPAPVVSSVPSVSLPTQTSFDRTPAPPDPARSASTPSMGIPAMPDLPRAASVAMGVPAMPDLPRSSGPLATTAIAYGGSMPSYGGSVPNYGGLPTNYGGLPTNYGGPIATQGQLFPTYPTNPQPQGSATPGNLVFGQPLPGVATYGTVQSQPLPVGSTAVVTALDNLSTGGVVVPVGTSLNLRYGGAQTLKLTSGAPRQETLVLQTAVVDRFGKTIIPAGSTVLGQFETDGAGSRFVTQALSFPGRNLAMSAQSAALGGRKVSNNKLLQNSGIGAVAGAILGGISGGNVIGGAAAGAAITYAIAPKSATIEPGQLVEVRLTQDLLAVR